MPGKLDKSLTGDTALPTWIRNTDQLLWLAQSKCTVEDNVVHGQQPPCRATWGVHRVPFPPPCSCPPHLVPLCKQLLAPSPASLPPISVPLPAWTASGSRPGDEEGWSAHLRLLKRANQTNANHNSWTLRLQALSRQLWCGTTEESVPWPSLLCTRPLDSEAVAFATTSTRGKTGHRQLQPWQLQTGCQVYQQEMDV